jgi:hypothetical protein
LKIEVGKACRHAVADKGLPVLDSGLVSLGKSKMHGEEACAERYD